MATKKIPEWESFTSEDYQQEASRLVHFSAKTVNSNIPACGVRISKNKVLDLPLVGVRTLLGDNAGVPLDYTKNAGKTAKIVKQIRGAERGEIPEGIQPNQVQEIVKIAAQATATAYEEGTDWVSPRLRQVLLPKDDGSYVAASPLGAGGLSWLLKQKLQTLEEVRTAEKKPAAFKQAFIGIGGSNAQNVGGLVRDMQRPLMFRAPTENPEIRRAFAIHYRGIDLRLPRKQMETYRTWFEAQLKAGDGQVRRSTMLTRQHEEALVCDIAQVVLRRGQYARALLETHKDDLSLAADVDSLLAPDLDDVVRGLIEPQSRHADWAYEFGGRLAQLIAAFDFGEAGFLLLDDAALARIRGWIRDYAR